MRYFLYVRKSQEDEGRQVQSIDDQIKRGRALAQTLGLTIIEILEESRSAKRPGRPLFNDMIARIEARKADGIIAWHPDRLARNAVDAGIIIDLLDRGKLHDLKFDSYGFENTPEGKWMLNIVLSQSKYFVDKLSKDVKRGMQSKVEKGHFPFRALPGYFNNRNERTIEADPERFVLVQRAMKLVLTRAFSPPEALDVLNNQWGFRTRKAPRSGGRPLSRTTFYDMLTNEFYTGVMKYDGQIYPGKHPPMLTRSEFDELQHILGRGKPLHRQKLEFDFTGLIKCGLCGCGITAERKIKHYKGTGRTRTYIYYHCSNARGGCSKQGITQEQVEVQILKLLSQITIDREFADWCLNPARQWQVQTAGLDQKSAEALARSLIVAERKRSNLFNEYLLHPDALTVEEFKEHKELILAEINELKKAIQAEATQMETLRHTVENVFDFAVNAEHYFTHGPTKLRKEIAGQLAVNYLLTLGKLTFELHPLLVPILQIEPSKKGSHNRNSGAYVPEFPDWCALPDEVRTLATDSNQPLEKVDWPTEGEYSHPEAHKYPDRTNEGAE